MTESMASVGFRAGTCRSRLGFRVWTRVGCRVWDSVMLRVMESLDD